MILDAIASLPTWEITLLVVALLLAFGFEFVNGFHDAANAVATVIYTNSLSPNKAVVWSGFFNFLGTMLGGIGVAYAIVHLLPVELLVNMNTHGGVAMVMALLGSAILWNVGTWYFGIPASSSHTLIGSILGVGIAHSLTKYGEWTHGVNIDKLWSVGMSLLISPLIGFFCAGVLLSVLKRNRPHPSLHSAPAPDSKPPGWIRAVLIGTCTGVSFAHGSNDGQKGMGLIMLILIGLLPAQFALNLQSGKVAPVLEATQELQKKLSAALETPAGSTFVDETQERVELRKSLVTADYVARKLEHKNSFAEIPATERWQFRQSLFEVSSGVTKYLAAHPHLPGEERDKLLALKATIRHSVEYIPFWVVLGVALSLGIGTMVGWKRIVVTVGEKIGKSHLTYGQGATAEFVAMSTIGLADIAGLPVSTTHVLSSGVAGTMYANKSGVNLGTVRSIAIAWVLTVPVSMALSGGLFLFLRTVL